MNEQLHTTVPRKRQEARKSFFFHLVIFLTVIIALAGYNYYSILHKVSEEQTVWWVQWALLGWGIGVLAHANCVFRKKEKVFAEWEKRQMARTERD